MSKSVDKIRDEVLALLNRLGRPLSKKDWVDLCEQVSADAQDLADAANAELRE